MSECNFKNYGAWWYCSPENKPLKEYERPFQLEVRALSRSIRKGYENVKNKTIEQMVLSVQNQATGGINDLIKNTAHGLNRLSSLWWHSKLALTTNYNPIFDRDAEAVHLLFYAKNPFEVIEIAASIISEYIYENLDQNQIDSLNRLLLKNEKSSINEMGRERFNEYAYHKIINEAPSIIENSIVKKTIISVLVYLIARRAFLNFNIFKRKENIKVNKPLSKGYIDVFLIASSCYGIIEKLDRASRRLQILSPALYNRLDKEKLSLTYFYFENEIGPILRIIGSKGLHDSYELLKAFEHLIKTTS
ncbi:MAG: hypothetical protein ACQEWL_16550 [Pseudomonadota bacterium]|uniref:hypothetical protein n=1 Tax=Providencia sp. PROV266 TaxID=2949954 RepID=UPI00234AE07A|nr:hypothetical protein [Providencia sp. PROV266]